MNSNGRFLFSPSVCPPPLFPSNDASYWLRSGVHANQEAASMEEGNKYKMAAHIKPGVGLLPGDGGIEALIRAARIVGRCCSEGRPKRGGGLRPPLGTAASSRPFACGAAACFPKARPGSCHLLPPRAAGGCLPAGPGCSSISFRLWRSPGWCQVVDLGEWGVA